MDLWHRQKTDSQVLINAVTGEVDFICPVSRLIRWDEKAGLPRDAIRSQ